MTAALTAAELLALDPLAPGLLRNRHNQGNYLGMIFGGQPLGQALAAAMTTVPDWPAHSLSAQFLRGGDEARPVDYAVETMRDGRRYAARRVVARQDGRAVFDLLASFHAPEDGPAHGGGVLGLPMPEALPTFAEFVAAHGDALPAHIVHRAALPFPIELKLCDPHEMLRADVPRATRDLWLRIPSAAGIVDPRDRQCLLAFLSDYWLAGTAAAMHPADERGFAIASLNHSLWFHAPADPADWLLYRTDSPWAGAGRGLARGQLYDRGGTLVASVAQELQLTAT